VLEQLQDEIPYSVACVVEEFREGGSPVYIRAMIYVERESQKGIVIGAKERGSARLARPRDRRSKRLSNKVYIWICA
jgi:GTP-binding protein Era